MDYEQQVTNPELSKKLKEIGVKQDALWAWRIGKDKNDKPRLLLVHGDEANTPITFISAFTVAELGELLPNGLEYIITTTKAINKWMCLCEHIEGAFRKTTNREWADTEVNARAQMLVYLLENKLI